MNLRLILLQPVRRRRFAMNYAPKSSRIVVSFRQDISFPLTPVIPTNPSPRPSPHPMGRGRRPAGPGFTGGYDQMECESAGRLTNDLQKLYADRTSRVPGS